MPGSLRLLVIEDTEEDYILLTRELRRLGYVPDTLRVYTAETVEEAIKSGWDIVISDWSMPTLNGLDAYRIVRASDPDVPFIIVSGTIGEDVAVDALRAGVDDFMVKGRFARLGPAIERARNSAALRRRQRAADLELERQRRETERSERLLRIVLDSVPDGVIVVNREGTLLTTNPAARQLLGLASDASFDVLLASWHVFRADRVTPVTRDELPLVRALAGEIVDREQLVLQRIQDGTSHQLSVSARPLQDPTGSSGAIAVFRDVSREIATQEQLMISDRMASVGLLAAGVAHEINNPLAAVTANIDMLASSLPPGGIKAEDTVELREMAEDARVAADRVRQIVRDLKIFSRHEDSGDKAVDIRRTLESTLRMAWNEIRHRAKLVKELPETPLVRGSESRLGQVFLNLLVNAAQAIPEGSADKHMIRVSTRLEGNHVVVEVGDTGAGMSAETQRRLFTPFFTTKPQGEGTGLGLAISYRIVTNLGGTIDVTSAPQRGTTFRVRLPVAADPTAEEVAPATASAPSRRGRILVVDDETMICTTIRRMLSRDHDVHTTTRAVEALDRVRAGETFDVILCDLMMPQMTGIELHAALASLGLADRIVFLTGGAFTPGARQFLDQVPNLRIEKPFDAQHLRAIVNDRLRG
jgi:PAS domain S-box-containing protein